MPRESMTPLERWLAVFHRQKPDRVPMDYWSTDEVTVKLKKHLGCASRAEMLNRLHVDFVVTVGPEYIGPALPAGYDIYGVKHQNVDFGSGMYSEPVSCPFAIFETVEEIEANYAWPSPDWWDYSNLNEQLIGFEDHPVAGGGSEPFLIYKNLRGQELAMLDLALRPEMVHYCLDKLFNLAYINTQRIFEALPGRITYTYVAEDMGGQRNLMFSPRHIREFLLPGMKRMIDLAHAAGVYAFHHNDGNVTQILPDMVGLGIDLLNPIQWRSDGMDRKMLKETYGDRLVFHGAMDNQYTLPFGTVQEVESEVIENLAIMGAAGGYILAPCHNLQPVTPVENILAMYETGYREGWVN
jgi:uroporphyrinogen decarboxylase